MSVSKYRLLSAIEAGFLPFILMYLKWYWVLVALLFAAGWMYFSKKGGVLQVKRYQIYLWGMSVLAAIAFFAADRAQNLAGYIAVLAGIVAYLMMMNILRVLRTSNLGVADKGRDSTGATK